LRFKFLSSFIVTVAICFAILGSLSIPSARADEYDKKTTMTFNEDFQVPGKVLPAGTYVFKLLDSGSDRNIVEIYNADQTQLITTVLAISDYRMETPDKTIVSFDERPAGQPEAVKAWFYPGDDSGVQFVYPKQKAADLAQANQQTVPSTSEEVLDSAVMKTAAIEEAEPAPPAPVASADNNGQPESDAAVATATELPQTASPISLIAIVGFFLLGAAFVLRRVSALPR
jgi:hypothetical protein